MKRSFTFIGLVLASGVVGFLLPGAVGTKIFISPKQAYSGFYHLAERNLDASPAAIAPVSARSSTSTVGAPGTVGAPVEGLIHLEVSLKNRRVKLYQSNRFIKSYPIAIGRKGWETPTGTFEVKQLFLEPAWINPLTNEYVSGSDPRNPLGRYWIGFWSDGTNWVGFHGTPEQLSVGRPVSHGCLRMYDADIAELFRLVQLGTVVTVKP